MTPILIDELTSHLFLHCDCCQDLLLERSSREGNDNGITGIYGTPFYLTARLSFSTCFYGISLMVRFCDFATFL